MSSIDFINIGLKQPDLVIPITTGSHSVNCYVKNRDGEFLVKERNTSPRIAILSHHLKVLANQPFCPRLLFEKSLDTKHIFVFRWIEGKSYFLEKLPQKTMAQIIKAYLDFLKVINKKVTTHLAPPDIPTELIQKIKSPYRFMIPDLEKIKKDLSYRPKLKIIHGDFHYKNILIKNNKLQSFLDFECFRKGLPTEDLIRFVLTNAEQHQFFRTKYSVALLKFLISATPFSKKDWLYGLDVFILNKYIRKLKKKNALTYLGLYRNTLLYRTLRHVIETS